MASSDGRKEEKEEDGTHLKHKQQMLNFQMRLHANRRNQPAIYKPNFDFYRAAFGGKTPIKRVVAQ